VYTVVLIFFVIILNWLIFEAMPGLNGNLYVIFSNPRLSPEQRNYMLQLYGVQGTPWDRFVKYITNMLTFNFGYSYESYHDVTSELLASGRLLNTLELLGTSTLLALVIGTLLGIFVAHKRGTSWDSFWVGASLTTFSLPTFFMGYILIFIFADSLHWLPPGNIVPVSWTAVGAILPAWWAQIPTRLEYLFLPALTLTVFSYGGFLLLTRATMLETLSDDYVVTARAKGLPERVVLMRHAFKNASLPIITAGALSFGAILGGAIITETVFNWDGIGRWLYNAVLYKDYPVMEAMFYIIALCVIGANFVSDIIYGIVDPRIKYE
jgi:peptide/nickel transport system permease protein